MLMRVANPDLADYPVRSVEKLRYADTDRQGRVRALAGLSLRAHAFELWQSER